MKATKIVHLYIYVMLKLYILNRNMVIENFGYTFLIAFLRNTLYKEAQYNI